MNRWTNKHHLESILNFDNRIEMQQQQKQGLHEWLSNYVGHREESHHEHTERLIRLKMVKTSEDSALFSQRKYWKYWFLFLVRSTTNIFFLRNFFLEVRVQNDQNKITRAPQDIGIFDTDNNRKGLKSHSWHRSSSSMSLTVWCACVPMSCVLTFQDNNRRICLLFL